MDCLPANSGVFTKMSPETIGTDEKLREQVVTLAGALPRPARTWPGGDARGSQARDSLRLRHAKCS